MYSLTRFLVTGIAGLGIFLLVKKTRTIYKRLYYRYLLIIFIALNYVLNFVPLENLFYSFDSVEKAYYYANFDKSNIQLVVSGKESDLVIGEKDNISTYLILPKTSNGWKVGQGINKKLRILTIKDGISFSVYQYKETSDFYIDVSGFDNEELMISDSRGSEFCKYNGNYYAYIQNFDEQYSINVNGQDFSFTEQSQIGGGAKGTVLFTSIVASAFALYYIACFLTVLRVEKITNLMQESDMSKVKNHVFPTRLLCKVLTFGVERKQMIQFYNYLCDMCYCA